MVSDIIKKVNLRFKFMYRLTNFFDKKNQENTPLQSNLRLFNYSISSWYGAVSKATSKKNCSVPRTRLLGSY